MNDEQILHDRESSEDTERHLAENRRKFESDCVFLLKQMMNGRRLSSSDVHDMKINDRRLRNLWEAGKCKREWMYRENKTGKKKRTHVEYFVDIPKPPTKKSITDWWGTKLIQAKMFGEK